MPWRVGYLKMPPDQGQQEAAGMKFESEVVPEALDRLRRVEGQPCGIIRMIQQGRKCQDVVQQLAAVGRAVDRVGLRLLTGQLQRCLSRADLLRRLGRHREAAAAYERAAAMAPTDAERDFLRRGGRTSR
jgi:DNA-binding FrmR family transcriptional regulator